jgi:hypothetical protein
MGLKSLTFSDGRRTTEQISTIKNPAAAHSHSGTGPTPHRRKGRRRTLIFPSSSRPDVSRGRLRPPEAQTCSARDSTTRDQQPPRHRLTRNWSMTSWRGPRYELFTGTTLAHTSHMFQWIGRPWTHNRRYSAARVSSFGENVRGTQYRHSYYVAPRYT